jgi:putative oxidoreductase
MIATSAAVASIRQRFSDVTLSAFRAVVGFLFACHGAAGFGLLGGIDGQGTAVPFGQWPGYWASVIELLGGILIALGLATRPVAILASGAMAFAYFTVHQPVAVLPLHNTGELAALFSWIFLLIAAVGPGHYALDTLLTKRRTRTA